MINLASPVWDKPRYIHELKKYRCMSHGKDSWFYNKSARELREMLEFLKEQKAELAPTNKR